MRPIPSRILTPIALITLLLIIIAGCSHNAGSPLDPGANAPATTAGTGIHEIATIGPDGGSIDLGWFRLDIAPGALAGTINVEVSGTKLEKPRDGAVVGGVPLGVRIQAFGDLIDSGKSPFVDGGYYTVTYNLDSLPDNGLKGDFTSANKCIDITSELMGSNGKVTTGCAWAHRKGDSISTFPKETEITLALVDFSNIPEIKGDAVFTDDPRELTGQYARYGEGIPFDSKNSLPLGNRIPVILIHGLNFYAQWAEPDSFSDQSAEYGYQSWVHLFNWMKKPNGPSLYDSFKFYWFCYPTGAPIFGNGSSAMMLNDHMGAWAYAHDPELLHRPVVIVAHSQGGLVAREWMQNLGGKVHKLFTFDTPHLGSPMVNVMDDLSYFPENAWMKTFLSAGIQDLAVNEPITYSPEWPLSFTSILLNPELGALNDDLDNSPDFQGKITYYGATDAHYPYPFDGTDIFCYGKLMMVTAPPAFKEKDGDHHSDCVVPWRSQYNQIDGGWHSSNNPRTSLDYYHCTVLNDDKILYRLSVDLLACKNSYPQYPIWETYPGGVTFVSPDDQSATVYYGNAFDVQGDAVQYNVYYVDSTTSTDPFNGAGHVKVSNAGSSSYKIEGLVNGDTYYFGVRASDDKGHEDGNTVVKSKVIGTPAPLDNFLWARTWGGSDYDQCYDVAADGSGNTYVTGNFTGTVDFDPGSGVDNHISNGSWDIFLSKFDSSGNFKWARTWGADNGSSVAVDGSGNVYVTGDFDGTVDFDPGSGVDNHSSNGYCDFFLSKFDSSGNFKWARTCLGEGGGYGSSVAVDGSGNVYVTGDFNGTLDFDPGSGVDNRTALSTDFFLSKFDSSGTFVWARTWGGSNWDHGVWDHGVSVDVDGSGNAYVTGNFYGTVDFDPGSGVDSHTPSGSNGDTFLSKFDSSGTFVWARTWGGGYYGHDVGVAVDGSGNVYVTGWFTGTVDFDPGSGVDNHTPSYNYDAFLSKFDSSGNFKWARTWGVSGGNGVAVDGSGNIYVTGYFGGYDVDFDPGPGVDNQCCGDIFLSKFDSSGTFVWARTWGGSENYDWGNRVAVDVSDNAYVIGWFYNRTVDFDPGSGVDNHTSNGADDAFLSKFAPE